MTPRNNYGSHSRLSIVGDASKMRSYHICAVSARVHNGAREGESLSVRHTCACAGACVCERVVINKSLSTVG